MIHIQFDLFYQTNNMLKKKLYFYCFPFARVVQSLALGQLITCFIPSPTKMANPQAYVYSSIIVGSTVLNLFVSHQYTFGLQNMGMKIRVACCSLMYRKILRLSQSALGKTTIGELVNLLSNDVSRFDTAVVQLHNVWLCPIEAVLIMYLLFLHVGVTATVGVAFLALFIPLQSK